MWSGLAVVPVGGGGPGRTSSRRAEPRSTPGSTGLEGAEGTGGPGCSARGRRQGLAAAPESDGDNYPGKSRT